MSPGCSCTSRYESHKPARGTGTKRLRPKAQKIWGLGSGMRSTSRRLKYGDIGECASVEGLCRCFERRRVAPVRGARCRESVCSRVIVATRAYDLIKPFLR